MIAALLAGLATASPALDVSLGGSPSGTTAARLQVGSWSSVTAQRGLPGGWTLRADYELARLRRHQPSVAIARRWVDGRWRVTGEAATGWLYQDGELARSGPTAALLVRAGRVGRVAPVVTLGALAAAPISRTVTITAQGEDRTLALGRELSLPGSLGVLVALRGQLALEVGLDMDWIAVPTVSIPGAYVALSASGGAR